LNPSSFFFTNRINKNSEPSAMQTMHLFHPTMQESCLDHAARTGSRKQRHCRLDLNMPGKHAGMTDTMHSRPPRARMCKGIAETWLKNMAGAPIEYDASAARTGWRMQRHCSA
jgi:hypothetical protein